eukprot:2110054-Heterocapsa_arctica.AAC.1
MHTVVVIVRDRELPARRELGAEEGGRAALEGPQAEPPRAAPGRGKKHRDQELPTFSKHF